MRASLPQGVRTTHEPVSARTTGATTPVLVTTTTAGPVWAEGVGVSPAVVLVVGSVGGTVVELPSVVDDALSAESLPPVEHAPANMSASASSCLDRVAIRTSVADGTRGPSPPRPSALRLRWGWPRPSPPRPGARPSWRQP